MINLDLSRRRTDFRNLGYGHIASPLKGGCGFQWASHTCGIQNTRGRLPIRQAIRNLRFVALMGGSPYGRPLRVRRLQFKTPDSMNENFKMTDNPSLCATALYRSPPLNEVE
jgi:hypothetical protein